MPPEILGPLGLTFALAVAVAFLAREHQRTDRLKDEALITLTKAVAEFPAALKDLTGEVVVAAKRERARRRGEPVDDK